MNPQDDAILSRLIAQRIVAAPQHRITFAEFMDLALYHPQVGYYANRALSIGVQGDFFTSPHLGQDFGELLAAQFVQMWTILGCPNSFTLVEMGAGQGLLAVDVLRYASHQFPEFFAALQYVIVERAAPLIAAQKRQLQPLLDRGFSIQWQSLSELMTNSVVGCVFSNELVDALPVHQVAVVNGQLQELYVSVSAGAGIAPPVSSTVASRVEDAEDIRFIEVFDQLSTSQLTDYFNLVDIDLLSPTYPENYRTEVNLAALEWMGTVADRLQRGFLLTIDYGYTSDRYYSPTRNQGTLQCYYQHAHHSDPYIHIGQQDITAHVDFTALQRWGDRQGLATLGFTQQGLFLLALGLGDRIAALGQSSATTPAEIHTTLRRREALHQLVNPLGLGNFGVLIQGKNLDPVPQLIGLHAPM